MAKSLLEQMADEQRAALGPKKYMPSHPKPTPPKKKKFVSSKPPVSLTFNPKVSAGRVTSQYGTPTAFRPITPPKTPNRPVSTPSTPPSTTKPSTDPMKEWKRTAEEERKKQMRLNERMRSAAMGDPTAKQYDITRDSVYKGKELQKEYEDAGKARKSAERLVSYGGREYGNHFLDQFAANYSAGDIQQEIYLAQSRYMDNPTNENKKAVNDLKTAQKMFVEKNKKPLESNGLVRKDLANYLPQLKGQLGEQATLGAMGLAVAGSVGLKAGAIVGSGKYSYDTMRGAAFDSLVEMGVDEDTARRAATDEGVISSIIEMVDTGVDIATLGVGSMIKSFTKTGAKKLAAKAANQAQRSAIKKLGIALGKWGINSAQEYAEEYTQEAVSVANENRMKNGAKGGKGELLAGAVDVVKDSFKNPNSETAQRLQEAGVGGFKIGAMMGGVTLAGTSIVTAQNMKSNKDLGSHIKETDNVNNIIDAGATLPEDSVAYHEAERLAKKMASGQKTTDEEVGQTARDVIEESQKQFIKEVRASQAQQKAQEAPLGKETKTKDATYLDRGTTAYAGVNNNGIKVSQQKAAIVQKLIDGSPVTEAEIKRLNFSSKAEREVFTQLTGVEIPENVAKSNNWKLQLRIAKEAHNVEPVSVSEEVSTPTESVDTASVESVPTASESDYEAFRNDYIEQNPEADEDTIRSEYEAYSEETAEPVYTTEDGVEMTREDIRQRLQRKGNVYSDEDLDVAINGLVQEGILTPNEEQEIVEQETIEQESKQKFESGLVRDEYTAKQDKALMDRIDAIAKMLGLRVRFADKVAGGNANAQIEGNEMLIEMDNENPIGFLFGHEITHRMQALDPKTYEAFKKAAIAEMSDYNKRRADMKSRYENRNIKISPSALDDEIVADYAGQLLQDGKTLDDFIARHNGDRTLLQFLHDVFEEIHAKLTGADKNNAKNALYKLEKALAASTEKMEQSVAAPSADGLSTGSIEKTFGLGKDKSMYSLKPYNNPAPKQKMSLSDGDPRLILDKYGNPIEITGRQVLSDLIAKNGKLNGLSEDEVATQQGNVMKFMDDMANFMRKAGIKYKFIGINDVNNANIIVNRNEDGSIHEIVMSAMVKNGEYPVNFDFTTICKRREAMSRFINELVKRHGTDNLSLTSANLFEMNQILRDAGYDTACLGCFVESKRYNVEAWAKSFVDKWNEVLDEVAPGTKVFFNFSESEVEETTNNNADAIDKELRDYFANNVKEKERKQGNRVTQIERLKEFDPKEMAALIDRAEKRFKDPNATGDKKVSEGLLKTIKEADKEYMSGEKGTALIKKLAKKGLIISEELNNREKIKSLIKSAPEFQKRLRMADLITPDGITNLVGMSKVFAGLVSGHYGTSTPKFAQGFVPYNNEIAYLADKKGKQSLRDYLISIGGLRSQSFSDFKIENVFDYIQMMAELTARKLPAHMYTKELACARILGRCGIKVNMSVMFDVLGKDYWGSEKLAKENAGLWRGVDGKGKLTYCVGDQAHSDLVYRLTGGKKRPFVQSIPYNEAVDLENRKEYSENIGIIGVGFGFKHIWMMLDDPNIRMIIPYHSSSLPIEIKDVTNLWLAQDFTDWQNTATLTGVRDSNGKDVKRNGEPVKLSDFKSYDEFMDWVEANNYTLDVKKAEAGFGSFPLYETLNENKDPRKTARMYVDWCFDNGYVPLFYQFARHKNYSKILYDFSVMNYKTDEAYIQHEVRMFDKNGNITGFGPGIKSVIGKEMATQNRYWEKMDSTMREPTLRAIYADNQYLAAVGRGDMETAQRIANEEAERAGIATPVEAVVNNEATGKPIPPTERFKTRPYAKSDIESGKVKTSLKDTEYMKAVESGNMEAAQKMVKAAAESAGFDTLVYHGSPRLGFTQVDLQKSDDKISFFATTEPGIASSYSGTTQTKELGEVSNLSKRENQDRLERELLDIGNDMFDQIDKIIDWTKNMSSYKRSNNPKPLKYVNRSKNFLTKLIKAARKGKGDYEDLINPMYDGVEEELLNAYAQIYNTPRKYVDTETFDMSFRGKPEVQAVFERMMDAFIPLEALFYNSVPGNMQMYANTDNLLEVPAHGQSWKKITFDTEDGNGPTFHTTREIARYAKDHGYGGIKITDVYDLGGRKIYGAEKKAGDIYAFLDPKTQVKSADPVTYDGSGNVIPLSERFNPKKDELRYSLKDTDSNGNKLSENQQKYFKDSKAVDEDGNLLVLYHGTSAEFFTFDKDKRGSNYGYDEKGFFFTDDIEEADAAADSAVENIGGDKRILSVYLNIENPLIVEARKALFNPAGSAVNYYDQNQDAIDAEAYDGEYDGVIVKGADGHNMYMVYDSEQIKSVDNKNPTADKDIRYSLKNSPATEESRKQFIADWDAKFGEGSAQAMFDDFRKMDRAVQRKERRAAETAAAKKTRQEWIKKRNLAVAQRDAQKTLRGLDAKDAKRDKAKALTAQEIGYKKELRHTKAEYNAIIAEIQHQANRDKAEAVRETKEVERAVAAVDKQAVEMGVKKQAAKRLRISQDAYSELKAQNNDNQKLRRNAGKNILRNKRLADKKHNQIVQENGTVKFIRDNPKEMSGVERIQAVGDKIRTVGRSAYRNFVNMAASIDEIAHRQRGGTLASTLVTALGASTSTTSTIYSTALVDRMGNHIGDSMRDVFLCMEGGKVNEDKQAILQAYILLMHSVDRMSIESKARKALLDFEIANAWLPNMDAKELAILAGMTEKEAQKVGKEKARSLALKYSKLMQEYAEAKNKPVFGDENGVPVDAKTSRRLAEEIARDNPWVVDKAEGIWSWWDKYMNAWVVGDSITAEQYASMKQMYPHYAPTYRKNEGGIGGAGFVGNGVASVGSVVKKATGSIKDIVNIEDSFAEMVGKGVKLARTNELYRNLIDTAMLDNDGLFADMMFFGEYGNALREGAILNGEPMDVIDEDAKVGLEKDGNAYKVTAWNDGRKYSAWIREDVYKSLLALSGNDVNDVERNVIKAGNIATGAMKTAITGVNPFFAARNIVRDVPTAVVNSISGASFGKYWLRAAAEIASNSDNWKTFQALGGTHAEYYNNESGFAESMSKGKSAFSKGIEKLGAFNEVTEAQTRFAEYLATIDRLGDTYENRLLGIKNSAEVTVDFSRKGRYGKVINAWVPYWNPAVQGIDKVFRSMVESPSGSSVMKQAFKTGGRALVLMTTLEALQIAMLKALDKEDDWEKLDDRTRDTYYCIPISSHKFLKVPKNREWAAIIGTPLMRLYEGFSGRENPFENWVDTSLIPNFLPPTDIIGISQIMDLKTNKDFANRTIVPYALKDGFKHDQYDTDSSMITRAASELAQKLNLDLSPMQMDYIIKDYFGDFGKLAVAATSEATWSGEDGWQDAFLNIVSKPFTADNRYSNYDVSAYYDTIEKLENEVKSLENHPNGTDVKDSTAYKTQKGLEKLYGKDIAELNKKAGGLPNGKEKDNVKAQIARLTGEAMDFYNDSMSGKIKEPKLSAQYSGLSSKVKDELIRMDSYVKDYAIEPTTTAPRAYSAGSKREFILDDEAKEIYREIYNRVYDEEYSKLFNRDSYKNADDRKKALKMEDARDDVSEIVRDEMLKWLKANREPTLKKRK